MNRILEIINYSSSHIMVFNSVLFVGLFTAFYLIYILISNKITARNIALLIFSLFFYYKLSGLYIILMCVIAASDFLIGKAILATSKENRKFTLLLFSLTLNIGSLLYFKYTVFFTGLFNTAFGTQLQAPVLSLLMPIGISFYVFKSLSYIFDCYNEMIEEPEKNYFDYLLYVSFFPNIIAGPIVRARDLLPALKLKSVFTRERMSRAFFLLMLGVLKKYLVADFLWNNFVERVFNTPTLFTGLENLIAVYMGAVQFYYDFSGYTDMMMGISLLLGFDIANNFNRPFMAQNITDLWRRWHITLSTWLSEYVFTPLNYSLRKFKKVGVVFASILTFIISGIWHGPRLTYILWGAMHGLAIGWDVASQDLRRGWKSKLSPNGYRFISVFLTFHFVVFTIVIFDAPDLFYAGDMYRMIFTQTNFSLFGQWIAIYWGVFVIFFIALFLQFTPPTWKQHLIKGFDSLHFLLKVIVVFLVILFVIQFYNSEAQNFIYLKF